jgi:hypothetical protein
MRSSPLRWIGKAHLLAGIGAAIIGMALSGCGGDKGTEGAAPPNVKEEIKAGQKAGMEQYMKGRGGSGAPTGPGGASTVPGDAATGGSGAPPSGTGK